MVMVRERGLCCLVLGADGWLVEMVSEILESMGHSVERALSGRDAISRCEAGRFDLALIDGQEHLENARAIKARAPSARVVLMTGNPRLFEAEGVDVILQKSVSVDDLEAVARG